MRKNMKVMSEMEWLKAFSTNLRMLVRTSKITQAELANRIGVDKSTVSRYMNGTRIPCLMHAINLAYVLGCDLDELLYFGGRIEG